MNRTANTIIRAYQYLLRLYPNSFQNQYSEEMDIVFRQSCKNAMESSSWVLMKLILRELRDLPINLLKEYFAIFWRGIMQTNLPSNQSLAKSFLRGSLGFGIRFAAIYILFCVVDSLFNYGTTVWHGPSIWNGFHLLHPTALAYGIGAGITGAAFSKQRAWLSAISVFLAYTLIWRLWVSIFLQQRTPEPTIME